MLLLKFVTFTLACLSFSAPMPSFAQQTKLQPPLPSRSTLPGLRPSSWFGEQVREEWKQSGIRMILNAPQNFDPTRPTRLIVYAAPNGNTIEQTLGSASDSGTDWHFDIQHIAAQTRRLREIMPQKNIVLAVVEAQGLSWPAWRQKHPDNAILLRGLIEDLRLQMGTWQSPGSPPLKISLSGHSGGGSFLFGFLNAFESLPEDVDRIAFLDANYSYNDRPDRHGDKLLTWLQNNPEHHLSVIAYDDRNIMLNGQKVVGSDGGTYRATQRMRDRFKKDVTLTQTQVQSPTGDVVTNSGVGGRLVMRVHQNPQNKILHTALVGEMNGFLEAMTQGTPQARVWGTFAISPRAYQQWIQGAATIPKRPLDAPGGAAFMKSLTLLSPTAREEAIATEICRGNIPDFLRTFQTITARFADPAGKEHNASYQVMPDYLAVGSNADFVRLPMTPQTAQRIADAFGCSLPTRKVVDEVYRAATVKLEPRLLTGLREATTTFEQHNSLIEIQRQGQPLGQLVAGHKKDVVVTNRLGERPNRVAIYGWHKLDGVAIQPLTIVHRDSYTDYSHGVRLLKRAIEVDGRERDIRTVLHDPAQWALLSDEGPVSHAAY